MKKELDNQIYQAELALKELEAQAAKAEKLVKGLKAKRAELPRMENEVDALVRGGYSEAYIQAKVYGSRTPNISIEDIAQAIEDSIEAHSTLNK